MAQKIRGITIELSADATGVLDAVKSTNQEIKSTTAQLKDVNQLLKLDPTNTQLLAQKTQLLQENIANVNEKLTTLKQAQKDMEANGVDKNSEQYMALEREIIATEQELKKLEQTAGSGSTALSKISTVTGELGDKMETAGKKLSYLSAGIAALGAASLAAFEEVDEGADIVIQKTGATGEAADALEESYKNVAGSIVGDFADIGTAVGEVNTRFGVTGEDLEDLSTEFLKFAEINDTDVNSAVSGVDRALKTFNVDQSQAKNVMGLLSSTAQSTGLSMDDMLSLLQSSGPTLKEMGLDIGSAVTLMGNFEAAGLDSGEMLGKLQKAAAYYNSEGLSMEEGLSDLILRLQDSDTAADATAEAYEIFGKRGGLAFITAAQEGKISIEDLTTSLDEYGSIVDDTYQQTLDGTDAMKLAWQNMQLGLGELGSAIGETLAPIMERITGVIQDIVEWFTSLDDSTRETIVTIGLIVAALGPLLVIGGKVLNGISSIASALSTLGNSSFGPLGIVIGAVGLAAAAIGGLASAMESAYLESSPFTEALDAVAQANEDLQTDIDTTKQKYDDQITAAESSATAAETLLEKLELLMEGYDGSAESGAIIQGVIAEINRLVPDMGLKWDEATNSLNMNTKEIYAQISAMKAQAMAAAAQDLYTESLKQQYEAEKNLTDAQQTMNDVLAQYGLTQQDVNLWLEQGSNAGAYLTHKMAEAVDGSFEFGLIMKDTVVPAVQNYEDAVTNAETVTDNVTYAEEQWTQALANAAIAAGESTQAIKDLYLQTFGEDMPAALQEAMDASTEAGVKIPQSIVDGLMSGQISVDEAATQITENMNKEVEAREAGEKTGAAYPEGATVAIKKNATPLGAAATEVTAELDQSENAYGYGADAGASYAAGIEDQQETARLATKVIYDEYVDGMDGLPDEMNGYGSDAGAELDSGFGGNSGSISTTIDDIWDLYYNTLGSILPGQMWSWGYTAGTKFKNGLDDQLDNITTKAGEIVTSITNGLTGLNLKMEQKGYSAGVNLKFGLQNALSNVYNNMVNAGYNAGIGFNNGLVAATATIYNSAYIIATNVANTIRSALSIKSPSRVMAQLGEYTGEGFALGIESTEASVREAVQSLANAATSFEGVNALNANAMVRSQGAASAAESRTEINAVADLLSTYLPYLAEQTNIVLDDGTLAGHMAPAINEALGVYQERAARG